MNEESAGSGSTIDQVSYSDAISEVENILAELEGSVVDVDHLADRVRRASELLAICRARLAVVEVDVAALVDALDPGDEPTHDSTGASP